MGEQTAKAFNFLPRQMNLWNAIAAFIEAGGSETELMAVYRAIAAMRGKGPSAIADNGLGKYARAAQLNGVAGGQHQCAGNGRQAPASPTPPHDDARGRQKIASNGLDNNASASSPQANGPGQPRSADKAVCRVPVPVREPTAAQIAAVTAVKTASAKIILNAFDRELTHTGRRWGNIYYRELDSMTEDGAIARAVKKHIGALRGDDRHKTLRELMTPREFSLLINKVRKHAA